MTLAFVAGGCAEPAGSSLPPTPLKTMGRFIVDAEGNRVKLAGYNWNKGEGPDMVMSGLQARHRDAIAADLQANGFNTIRLVWSNELVESNNLVDPVFLAANPDLVGKTTLEVMDAVIESLATHGLMIVLNNHISDAIYCCKSDDDNTLWYNDRFPETAWVDDWKAVAARYRDQPAVIGADLRNEPRFFAYFGPDAGAELDWAAAAELGGNAVLSVAPHWLIFVEGVNYAQELSNAGARPIALDIPNRLVYSVHDYPWFNGDITAEEMVAKWERNWAFLFRDPEKPVPVWIGEFGLCNNCWNKGDQTQIWFDTFTGFLKDNDLDWCWWMMHGDDSESGWGMFNQSTGIPLVQGLLDVHRDMIVPTSGPGVDS